MAGCNQVQRLGPRVTIRRGHERPNVISEKSPARLAALKAVVAEAVRAADDQFEVVEEHLAPVEQHKPEDRDLIVCVSVITAVDGE